MVSSSPRTVFRRMLNAGVVIFAAQVSIACASTNESSLASCLSQFELADKAKGAVPTVIDADSRTKCNQLDERLSKQFASTANMPDISISLSPTGTVLLATLNRLFVVERNDPDIALGLFPFPKQDWRQIIDLRSLIAHEKIIPVWNGNAWVDGWPLIANGNKIPQELADMLVNMNYTEQNLGFSSVPLEKRNNITFSGEYLFRMGEARARLLNAGYPTAFDKELGIWRITGTNAPAASPAP